MAKLYNLARVETATSGTGTITLGSAVSGFLTFAGAGVSDGETVSYGIRDGAASEAGRGVYTAAGTTLTRVVSKSTNADAAIDLSGSAEVFITALAEDINKDIGCRAYHNTTQTIAHVTSTNFSLNAERYDTDNNHDTSSNNSRLTCKTAGKYIIVGNIEYGADIGDVRALEIYLNGETLIGYLTTNAYNLSTAGFPIRMVVASIWNLVVNDWVELRGYQNSGSTITIPASTGRECELAMQMIAEVG